MLTLSFLLDDEVKEVTHVYHRIPNQGDRVSLDGTVYLVWKVKHFPPQGYAEVHLDTVGATDDSHRF